MNNIPGTQVQRARLIALDLAALVLRAAAVGLCVALVLAGATLLFSSQSEAAAETPQALARVEIEVESKGFLSRKPTPNGLHQLVLQIATHVQKGRRARAAVEIFIGAAHG